MSDKLHEHIASLMRSGASSGSARPKQGDKTAQNKRGAKREDGNKVKGEEDVNIIYTNLVPEIHDKVLPKGAGKKAAENPEDVVNNFVTTAIVSTINTTKEDAARLAVSKLTDQWLLLEQARPVTAQTKAKKQQRMHVRSRVGRATAKTKRENGFIIPSGKISAEMGYSKLQFLRSLWLAYADDLLSGCTTVEMAATRLVHADFHGATVKVVQSKTPPVLGLEGTVVQETAAVFKIVTKENVCKTVPKAESIFEVTTSKFRVLLFGKNICQKPSERSKKKNKVKYTIEIL